MEQLPLEVLTLVAGHLDRSSLLALCLVSRQCDAACTSHKWSKATIPYDIDTSTTSIEHLGKNSRHIRVLQIIPTELYKDELLNVHNYPTKYDLSLLDNARREWHARSDILVDFVLSLSALTDFYWACREVVPSDIIKHLETIGCDLHIRDLDLAAYAPVIEASEQLAQTICLRSVRRHAGAGPDIHYTILKSVIATSPRLNHADLGWASTFEVTTGNMMLLSRTTAQYHNTASETFQRRGAVRSLEISDGDGAFDISWWNNISNVEELRSLKLLRGFPQDYAMLASSAIVNLVELVIYTGELLHEPDQFMTFLARQSRLQHLDITAHPTSVALPSVLAISEVCGRQLRVLRCSDNFVNVSVFHRLLECCPQLEHLGIGIYRLQGSTAELAMYRALGALPALRVAELAIRSSQHRHYWRGDEIPIVPGLGTEQLDIAYLAARDLAMDETLATSIFETISRAKSPYTPRLERVEIDVDSDLALLTLMDPLRQFLSYIAVSQTCHGSTRDDCLHQCTVKARHVDYYDDDMSTLSVTRRWKNVPHRLWPESRRRHVSEVWKSFPILQAPE